MNAEKALGAHPNDLKLRRKLLQVARYEIPPPEEAEDAPQPEPAPPVEPTQAVASLPFHPPPSSPPGSPGFSFQPPPAAPPLGLPFQPPSAAQLQTPATHPDRTLAVQQYPTLASPPVLAPPPQMEPPPPLAAPE